MCVCVQCFLSVVAYISESNYFLLHVQNNFGDSSISIYPSIVCVCVCVCVCVSVRERVYMILRAGLKLITRAWYIVPEPTATEHKFSDLESIAKQSWAHRTSSPLKRYIIELIWIVYCPCTQRHTQKDKYSQTHTHTHTPHTHTFIYIYIYIYIYDSNSNYIYIYILYIVELKPYLSFKGYFTHHYSTPF